MSDRPYNSLEEGWSDFSAAGGTVSVGDPQLAKDCFYAGAMVAIELILDPESPAALRDIAGEVVAFMDEKLRREKAPSTH